MRKITIYEALDGTLFEHESGCRAYEGEFGNYPGVLNMSPERREKIVARKNQIIAEEHALRQMKVAREIMKEDRNTLRDLARR